MNPNDILGKKGKDKINGFEGTVTGVAFYLTGCTQYLLEAKVKDNETKTMWTDDARVVFADGSQEKSGNPGGPQRNAPKR